MKTTFKLLRWVLPLIITTALLLPQPQVRAGDNIIWTGNVDITRNYSGSYGSGDGGSNTSWQGSQRVTYKYTSERTVLVDAEFTYHRLDTSFDGVSTCQREMVSKGNHLQTYPEEVSVSQGSTTDYVSWGHVVKNYLADDYQVNGTITWSGGKTCHNETEQISTSCSGAGDAGACLPLGYYWSASGPHSQFHSANGSSSINESKITWKLTAGTLSSARKFSSERSQALEDMAREFGLLAGYLGGAATVMAVIPIVQASAPAMGLIGFGTGVLAAGLLWLASDPPDSNYMVIAEPITPRVSQQPYTATADGLTQAEADAFNALLTNYEQQIGLLWALVTSLERSSGAFYAGDMVWEERQFAAAEKYFAQLEPLLNAEPGLLTNLQNALAADSRMTNITITEQDIFNYQERISTSGFTITETQVLTELGMSDTEQNEIRHNIASANFMVAAKMGGGKLTQVWTDPLMLNAIEELKLVVQEGLPSLPSPKRIFVPIILRNPNSGW